MSESESTSQCSECPLAMMAGYSKLCRKDKCKLWYKDCLIRTCLLEIIDENIRTSNIKV